MRRLVATQPMTDNRSRRSEREAMNPSRDEPAGLAQFIQICASQNDLFALDGQGNIYQYNFTTTTWEKLAASRSHEGPKRGNHTRAADTERSSRQT